MRQVWLARCCVGTITADAHPCSTSAFCNQLPTHAPPAHRRLYNLQPPAPGNYHLQFEFGLAAAGTTFYLDDTQVFDLTLPASPNPLPPVNGADGGAAGGGGGSGGVGTVHPPTSGTLIAAASEDFTAPAPFAYSLAQFEGAAATVSFATGAAAVTVTKPGTAAWHLQLVGGAFIPLSAAGVYSARLAASASAVATINVLWLREGTFALLGLKSFSVGPTAQVLELAPQSPPTDGNYHLQVCSFVWVGRGCGLYDRFPAVFCCCTCI